MHFYVHWPLSWASQLSVHIHNPLLAGTVCGYHSICAKPNWRVTFSFWYHHFGLIIHAPTKLSVSPILFCLNTIFEVHQLLTSFRESIVFWSSDVKTLTGRFLGQRRRFSNDWPLPMSKAVLVTVPWDICFLRRSSISSSRSSGRQWNGTFWKARRHSVFCPWIEQETNKLVLWNVISYIFQR
jgi:hypothetical protein